MKIDHVIVFVYYYNNNQHDQSMAGSNVFIRPDSKCLQLYADRRELSKQSNLNDEIFD